MASRKTRTARAPRAATATNGPVELAWDEQLMLSGIVARDEKIQELVKPLREDYEKVMRRIEERLGLKAGALAQGGTHMIIDNFVRELPAPVIAEPGGDVVIVEPEPEVIAIAGEAAAGDHVEPGSAGAAAEAGG
jgi:hypothetical protein